ncbi:MAG: hypothetical protein IPJ52_05415 [Rhodocyclaceae bacterium]|nr:hypothetical protein [Rhodocyclaceae bacterium]
MGMQVPDNDGKSYHAGRGWPATLNSSRQFGNAAYNFFIVNGYRNPGGCT